MFVEHVKHNKNFKSMMQLIIIGAGGMGREVFHLATECTGYKKQYTIKGFLDDNLHALDDFKFPYPPVMGTISDYQVQDDDIFVCSIGDVHTKVRIVEQIEAKGGRFISLIHPDVQINKTAQLGKGILAFHHVHVGSEAIVGNHVMLQSYCGIGHDVIIGDYTRVDPKVSVVGGVKVGNRVTLHSMCIINHRVSVGDDAVVGALSFVIRKVKPGITVLGNPAKEI